MPLFGHCRHQPWRLGKVEHRHLWTAAEADACRGAGEPMSAWRCEESLSGTILDNALALTTTGGTRWVGDRSATGRTDPNSFRADTQEFWVRPDIDAINNSPRTHPHNAYIEKKPTCHAAKRVRCGSLK